MFNRNTNVVVRGGDSEHYHNHNTTNEFKVLNQSGFEVLKTNRKANLVRYHKDSKEAKLLLSPNPTFERIEIIQIGEYYVDCDNPFSVYLYDFISVGAEVLKIVLYGDDIYFELLDMNPRIIKRIKSFQYPYKENNYGNEEIEITSSNLLHMPLYNLNGIPNSMPPSLRSAYDKRLEIENRT